ncbi:fibronectin type III domain-containing protein [Pedobacter sp. NJ-S-72]
MKFFTAFSLYMLLTLTAFSKSVPFQLKTVATRSWIRLCWNDNSNVKEYKIYWSAKNIKPKNANITLHGYQTRYYIQGVKPETNYYVWLTAINKTAATKIISVTAFQKCSPLKSGN